MMKLYSQTHSPFARKVIVFAHESNVINDIEVIHQETSPMLRNEFIYSLNPLGKVPILVTGDNKSIFDSYVICEYLSHYCGNYAELLPLTLQERLDVLELHSLADSMSFSGITARYDMERRPKKYRYKKYLDAQLSKLNSCYDYLESKIDLTQNINLGLISIATSLAWIEFRKLPSFTHNRPRLEKWFEEFCLKDSMQSTQYSGQTYDE